MRMIFQYLLICKHLQWNNSYTIVSGVVCGVVVVQYSQGNLKLKVTL